MGEFPMFEVYNVDVYTGEEISNSELLASKNISESEFLELAKTTCEEYYENTYGESIAEYSEDIKESYEKQLKSLSDKDYSADVPMFLNFEGKLCFVELIPSLAGAEAYYRVVNLGI